MEIPLAIRRPRRAYVKIRAWSVDFQWEGWKSYTDDIMNSCFHPYVDLKIDDTNQYKSCTLLFWGKSQPDTSGNHGFWSWSLSVFPCFPSCFPLSTNPKLQNLMVIRASRRNSASPASSGQFTAAAKTCGPDGYPPVNIKIAQNSWDGSGCCVRNDICRYWSIAIYSILYVICICNWL
jgi:hypothetical protein